MPSPGPPGSLTRAAPQRNWTRAASRVTLTVPDFTMPWNARRVPGHQRSRGQVTGLVSSRGDGFLTTPESARLLRVQPWLIRKWRQRGWLKPQGLDERNRPLHTAEALRAAEKLVREHGLETSGVDPRLRRGRTREPGAAQAETAQAA